MDGMNAAWCRPMAVVAKTVCFLLASPEETRRVPQWGRSSQHRRALASCTVWQQYMSIFPHNIFFFLCWPKIAQP